MPTILADIYLAEVSSASHVQDFVVDVTFSDGICRRIDLAPFLHGPIFEPIRANREFFSAVRVQAGTIGWENGADIDPDTLYYDGNPPWAGADNAPKASSKAPSVRRRTRSKAKA